VPDGGCGRTRRTRLPHRGASQPHAWSATEMTSILLKRMSPGAGLHVRGLKAVQRMLGHASAAMTLDFSADLFKDNPGEVRTDSVGHSPIQRCCGAEDKIPMKARVPRNFGWSCGRGRRDSTSR
jgi:hypothetical protein